VGVYAPTEDFGPYIGVLQRFGPPDVVPLDPFAGNAAAIEEARGFREIVQAVSVRLAADANPANRLARVRWFAGEAVPFAQAIAQAPVTTGLTVAVCFAVDGNAGGAVASGALVVPIPEILMLPGWQLAVDVVGGLAGDAVADVRVLRQRFRLLDVGENKG
jgi:hypothetical protein